MSSIKWIKLNVDMFDDEKIKIIQSMPEGDSLLIVWIKLITLAGKTNDGGYIYINENMPYTEDMLATIMNKPKNIISLALSTFDKLGMIENDEKGIYLVNFEKHQSLDKLEKIREQTRLRVAKHREKIKNNNVTLQVTHSNATDIDIDKDIEIDIYNIYENQIGTLNPKKYEEFTALIDKYGEEKVKEAIKKAVDNNKKSFEYVKALLTNGIYKSKKTIDTPDWMNKEIQYTEMNEKELEELKKELEMFN
jgi:predicted phage replisome organizer